MILHKYKGPLVASAVILSLSESAKNIQEARAIRIPEAPDPNTGAASSVDTSPSAVSSLDPSPSAASSVDLPALARSFPYRKPPMAKSKADVGTDTNSGLTDLSTREVDISQGDFDPELFHTSVDMFDPYSLPGYLPDGFIERAEEVSELATILLQVGLG